MRPEPAGERFCTRWNLSSARNSSIFEHNNDKNKKLKLYICKNENLYLVFFGFFDIIYAAVTNSRHKGKPEPLGREESKPESISLPAGVSRMCVFPAPNSARLARNFPLFRLIPGYLRLFTPIPRAFFSHQPVRPHPQRGERAPSRASVGASPTALCAYLRQLAATCAFFR